MPTDMQPQRIQRKRTKGWKMPDGAVYVGRPTQYGNPFVVGAIDSARCVEAYRRLLLFDYRWFRQHGLSWTAAAWMGSIGASERQRRHAVMAWLNELRGKDLACWCRLDQPCHANVLLEMANAD